MKDPNPDIENMMIAQVLNAPKKPPKGLITNKEYLVFANSLCTPTTCTLKRVSVSGFREELMQMGKGN
jgi:Golgi nucleoside diphosphatase